MGCCSIFIVLVTSLILIDIVTSFKRCYQHEMSLLSDWKNPIMPSGLTRTVSTYGTQTSFRFLQLNLKKNSDLFVHTFFSVPPLQSLGGITNYQLRKKGEVFLCYQ